MIVLDGYSVEAKPPVEIFKEEVQNTKLEGKRNRSCDHHFIKIKGFSESQKGQCNQPPPLS